MKLEEYRKFAYSIQHKSHSRSHSHTMSALKSRVSIPLLAAFLLYSLFICYGSLFPFGEWRAVQDDWWTFLFAAPPRFITRTDLSTNLLVYLPFGMLGAALLAPHMRVRHALPWVFVFAALFSATMETLQQFVPNRVASNLDIAANAFGALAGAVLFRIAQSKRWPGRILFSWRERWFAPGRMTDLGLMLLALWALSQLSLELPSLLAGDLHRGFTPYWEALPDFSRIQPERAVIYALEIIGLGFFARALAKQKTQGIVVAAVLLFAIAFKFIAAAVLVKFSVLARLVSLEVLIGMGMGLVVLLVWLQRNAEQVPHAAAIVFCLALAGAKAWWAPTTSAMTLPFSYSPERMLNITGLAAFASSLWPYQAALFLGVHGMLQTAHRD